MSATASLTAPVVHVELLHDSAGADVTDSMVLDDVLRLHEAAERCYGRAVVRLSMEGGDLGVRLLARGADDTVYYPQGASMWRDAYGHPARWRVTSRPDGTPVAIVWEVIGLMPSIYTAPDFQKAVREAVRS